MRGKGTWVVVVVALGLTLAFVDAAPTTEAANLLASAESLVTRQTFTIDGATLLAQTTEHVAVDGRTIATASPTLSVAAAAIYGAASVATGATFANRLAAVTRLLGITLAVVPHLLLIVFAGRFFIDDPRLRLVAAATVAFAFLGAGYATGVNRYTPAAAALVIGMACARRVQGGERVGRRPWAVAGFCAGTLPVLHAPSALFGVALAWHTWLVDPGRFIELFLPNALVPIGVHLALTAAATGTLLSSRSPNRARGDVVGRLVHATIGVRGFFAMTPLLVVGFLVALGDLWRRAPRWREAAVATLPTLGLLALHAVAGDATTATVGSPELMVAMPLLLIFAVRWLQRARRPIAYAALLSVSAANALDAIVSGPWRVGRWQRMLAAAGLGLR